MRRQLCCHTRKIMICNKTTLDAMDSPAAGDNAIPAIEDAPFGRPKSSSISKSILSSASGHKRGLSGNLLSRLPSFLRKQSSEDAINSALSASQDDKKQSDGTPQQNPIIERVIAVQSPGRKRKGSLRKAALLGTGLLGLDRRLANVELPRRRSSLQKSEASPTKSDALGFGFELQYEESSSESFPDPQKKPSPETNLDVSPITTGVFKGPLAPSTSPSEEYDALSLPRTSTDTSLPPPSDAQLPSLSPSSSNSSDLARLSPARRRSSTKLLSPLGGVNLTDFPGLIDEPWDYSATEWWGWVVLIVTWIVFVVGMGSCLEVWSWAWDVGETPYAPPELEDDPTLPIVGYYPALLVLTGVMSWVWVVVNWLGMKYFKHAKDV